jgi:hypothetical protein
MNESTQTKRCDNLSCICDTPLAAAFCSNYCAKADQEAELPLQCECSHAPCVNAMKAELTGIGTLATA